MFKEEFRRFIAALGLSVIIILGFFYAERTQMGGFILSPLSAILHPSAESLFARLDGLGYRDVHTALREFSRGELEIAANFLLKKVSDQQLDNFMRKHIGGKRAAQFLDKPAYAECVINGKDALQELRQVRWDTEWSARVATYSRAQKEEMAKCLIPKMEKHELTGFIEGYPGG